jgi:predicted nucleic acid-binding protein
VLIVDTGVIVAAADQTDTKHAESVSVVSDDPGPLVTSALVIAEAAYLLDRELGPAAEASLYTSIIEGDLTIELLTTLDWERVRDLVTTYADLRLGGTDASLVAIAERLKATRVATLNRRHFAVVRPKHCDAFELIP